MKPGTESLLVLFIIVIATLITYWISNYELVTIFPGISAMAAFVIIWNISEPPNLKIEQHECPKCGHWMEEKTQYCPECGEKLA